MLFTSPGGAYAYLEDGMQVLVQAKSSNRVVQVFPDVQSKLLLVERQELQRACFVRHLILVAAVNGEGLLIVVHSILVVP